MLSTALAPCGYPTLSDGAKARRRVNAALRGPVVEVLAELLPEVARLPKREAFDLIMSDCDLLHRCFRAFRARRRHFRLLLVDRGDRPVKGDNELLYCGRTLNQVVAMIVRSAAKRYFRWHLDPPPKAKAAPRTEMDVGSGWVGWLDHLFEPPPATSPAPPAPRDSPADRLYDAIKEYLLHDWQVPIIPQYARLTPDEVREMGPRLLDFHEPGQLETHIDGIVAPAPAAPEVAAPPPVEVEEADDQRASLSDFLIPDGSRLSIRAALPILQSLEERAVVRPADNEARRLLCESLSATGAATVRQLAVDFGLPPMSLVAFLAAAADTLPADAYRRLLGGGCDREALRLMIARARVSGLSPASPPAMIAAFVRVLFAPFSVRVTTPR